MFFWSHFSQLVLKMGGLIQEILFVTNNVKFWSTRCLSLEFLVFWPSVALFNCTTRLYFWSDSRDFFHLLFYGGCTDLTILGLSSQTLFHQSSEVETIMSASVFVEHSLSQIPSSAECLDFSSSPSKQLWGALKQYLRKNLVFCTNQGGVGRPWSDSRTTFQENALIPSLNANAIKNFV